MLLSKLEAVTKYFSKNSVFNRSKGGPITLKHCYWIIGLRLYQEHSNEPMVLYASTSDNVQQNFTPGQTNSSEIHFYFTTQSIHFYHTITSSGQVRCTRQLPLRGPPIRRIERRVVQRSIVPVHTPQRKVVDTSFVQVILLQCKNSEESLTRGI